jgi:hypothetical protein
MNQQEYAALSALRFNWALTHDDIWLPSRFHVEGLHSGVERQVLAGIREATDPEGRNPIGIVIQGQKGAGKTHLLGWVRQQIHRAEGYFFVVRLVAETDFWGSALGAIREDLSRHHEDGQLQITTLLRRLSTLLRLPPEVANAICGTDRLTPELLDAFVIALRRHDPQLGDSEDTARALVMQASTDLTASSIARDYLDGDDEVTAEGRSTWRIPSRVKKPELIVRDVSRLLALTGPTVIAVDQIDTVLAQSHEDVLLAKLAEGLMALREVTRRTLSIIACLQDSWERLMRDKAADTVGDRFRQARQLDRIHDPRLARALVEKRFGVTYQGIGFTPPYPSWPIKPTAFHDGLVCTPRRLLKLIDSHVAACLADDEVRELGVIDVDADVAPTPVPAPIRSSVDLATFDARFEELRRTADVLPALDELTEDRAMPALLSAGLTAWIVERGGSGQEWRQDPLPNGRPPLHARLVQTLDEESDSEAHWAFRAIGHHNARAALSRIQHARTAAGLHRRTTGRDLVLLRNAGWSGGRATQQELDSFREAGGRDMPITDDDLRTFSALQRLLAENTEGLVGWLTTRQPAGRSELFGKVLPAGTVPVDGPAWPSSDVDNPETPVPARRPTAVPLGHSVTDDGGVTVDLELLRKHMVIFAGSGSGKTVFIRRVVEECALLGVSAIVLDPNNDLARLGDPWPAPQSAWRAGDAEKAAEYHSEVEVVVWTPGHTARPLSFPALPDFASALDDENEFKSAVDVAVDTLAPRAKINGAAVKAEHSRAVLREAVRYYGRRGERSLAGFIAMLSDLPDGVSRMGNAGRLAAELAETLRAATVNDPLFGGGGESVDPGTLLTPSEGKRARVSVVSFIGLSSDEQRQGLTSQLQMELFAWIKAHPAREKPLGGLLVMDEAQDIAPAAGQTASTRSTIMLAAQARKFGLGLVFATQAPKGLHNLVSGNATTMAIGRLGVPAQITAAQDMARARGSSVSDVGRLRTGQFYLASEHFAFRKVSTLLCLSHHPASPLTPEEVVERASRAP